MAQAGQAKTGREGLGQGIGVATEQVEPGCHVSGQIGAQQHQPEGQAGKVHSQQHQPEGKAGKVHSQQHQPDGQAGKVHSERHQPEGQAGQCAIMHSPQVKRVQPGAQVFPVKGREDGRSEIKVDVQGGKEELKNEHTQSGQAIAQVQGVLSSGEQRCVRSVAVPFQAQAIRAEAGSKELAQLANQVGSLVLYARGGCYIGGCL